MTFFLVLSVDVSLLWLAVRDGIKQLSGADEETSTQGGDWLDKKEVGTQYAESHEMPWIGPTVSSPTDSFHGRSQSWRSRTANSHRPGNSVEHGQSYFVEGEEVPLIAQS